MSTCYLCNEDFVTAKFLRHHFANFHKAFSCTFSGCDKYFQSARALLIHFNGHSATARERPYRCQHPGCKKTFATPGTLQGHKEVHERRRWSCPFPGCDKTYAQKRGVNRHEKIHYEIQSCSLAEEYYYVLSNAAAAADCSTLKDDQVQFSGLQPTV